MDAAVIVQFDQNGELSYHVIGDDRVRLFIVDERAPHDRVYEWTQRSPASEFRRLIPEGAEIGHGKDSRHAAIAARIEAGGKPHLTVISTEHLT